MDKRIREVISECRFDLATNFELPAISILTRHASRLGMTRHEFEALLEPQSQINGELNMPSSTYEEITSQIVKQLEAGVVPWAKPWTSSFPTNLKSQKPYRGINVFLLACQGYASPYWLTYKQAASIGGNVKRGEHGTKIAFWKISDYRRQDAETGELADTDSKAVRLRHYTVFNVAQCDNLPDFGTGRVLNPIAECESVVSAMPNAPTIVQDGNAWYRPSTDTVGIPARDAFNSAEAYYATLFHELTHATGHKSRLDRFEETSADHQFGSESYSKEELVAELGAAMLCAFTGIAPQIIGNSAAYLQTWITRLKADSRLIISAASAAQKAADHILGQGGERE